LITRPSRPDEEKFPRGKQIYRMPLASRIDQRFKNLVVSAAYPWGHLARMLPMAIRHRAYRKLSSPLVLLLSSLLFLSGCEPITMTLFGVGAGVTTGTSVSYTIDGYAYRTFTAPISEVEDATRTALNRMGIKVAASARTEQGKALSARTSDRDIEIELERGSPRTTRIRTVAKQGIFFKDHLLREWVILTRF
jgi:hypothetical protein